MIGIIYAPPETLAQPTNHRTNTWKKTRPDFGWATCLPGSI